MIRRSFLKMPLVASVIPFAKPPMHVDYPKKGILVKAGEDRFGKSLNYLGARFDLKVSGKDTNGAFCIYDTTRYEKIGPAMHIHPNLDEWFYVIDGEFKIQVGDETFRLKAGDSVLGPRGVPHAFVKTSEGPARLLLSHQPAGQMEACFEEGSKMKNPTLEQRRAMIEKYDMVYAGPPLTAD